MFVLQEQAAVSALSCEGRSITATTVAKARTEERVIITYQRTARHMYITNVCSKQAEIVVNAVRDLGKYRKYRAPFLFLVLLILRGSGHEKRPHFQTFVKLTVVTTSPHY